MKQRDLELLSSYLDGQLSSSDSARLETRLKTDRELATVMDDLRTARGYLRQLPQRRAPRNFTLTRKMVGQNPPLPRAYPAFRWVTALATLMFFLTYGLNFLAPQLTARPIYGMGGGGAPETYSAEAPALAATEAPATQAPAEPQFAAPALTATPEIAGSRIADTPAAKNGVEPTAQADLFAQSQPQDSQQLPQPQPQPAPPLVAPIWQYLLLGVAILSGVLMLVMRQFSSRRWK